MKERIILKQHGTAYKVQSLENRIEPAIGEVLSFKQAEALLIEAKTKKLLTVKVV